MEFQAFKVEGIKKENELNTLFVKLNKENIAIEERKKDKIISKREIGLPYIIEADDIEISWVKTKNLIIPYIIVEVMVCCLNYFVFRSTQLASAVTVIEIMIGRLISKEPIFPRKIEVYKFAIIYWDERVDDINKINVICRKKEKEELFLFKISLDRKLEVVEKLPEVLEYYKKMEEQNKA